MEIRSLEELTTPDGRVGRFGPFGLMTDRIMKPEASVRFIQGMIAEYDLCPDVPNSVREYFELSRKLHIYGCFAYEFFTEASLRAYFAVELALKVRFLEAYQNRIPLVERETGTLATPEVNTYAQLVEAIARTGPYPYYPPKGKRPWRLQDHPGFNGSLDGLMKWAVQTGLLHGKRIDQVLDALRQLRNFAAHPTGTTIILPVMSAEAIEGTSRIINQLWGQMPHDRIVAAGPPEMRVFGVRHSPEGTSRMSCPIEELQQIEEDSRTGNWLLLEAATQDEWNLLHWHPNYELTLYPTVLLWEGDSWEEAVATWETYRTAEHAPSTPQWEKRLFAVRHDAGGYEPRRTPGQFRRLDPAKREIPGARWKILRLDRPTEEDEGYIQGWSIPDLDERWRSSESPPGEEMGDFATWGEADQRLRELEEAP